MRSLAGRRLLVHSSEIDRQSARVHIRNRVRDALFRVQLFSSLAKLLKQEDVFHDLKLYRVGRSGRGLLEAARLMSRQELFAGFIF
jgi:hypothetical protein